MSVWTLVVGLLGLLTFSVLVGLAIGSILGQISREISYVLESEPCGALGRERGRWSMSPNAAWSAPGSSARPANRV